MNRSLTKQQLIDLILANKGIIIKICNSYCSDKNYREDLGQEIIYQLLRSGENFQSGNKFSTWMYRIALNVAISFYRKQKTNTQVVAYTDLPFEIEDTDDGKREMNENISRLQKMISLLGPLEKAMMLLYLDSKSYAEIAEVLDITETNVATRISRIKIRLKQQFNYLNQ